MSDLPIAIAAEQASGELNYQHLCRQTDEAVMQQMQRGNHDALAILFGRYWRFVFGIALRMLRDRAEAEDLTQSVFFEIYRSADRFDASKGTFKTWVGQYAYHRGLDRRQYLRLRNICHSACDIDQILADLTTEDEGSTGLYPAEASQTVAHALAKLPTAQRIAIELSFFDGLSMKEIAERQRQTVGNIRHHYYRGLERLRTLFNDGFRGRQLREPEGINE